MCPLVRAPRTLPYALLATWLMSFIIVSPASRVDFEAKICLGVSEELPCARPCVTSAAPSRWGHIHVRSRTRSVSLGIRPSSGLAGGDNLYCRRCCELCQ
ncbi:hypothetical protein FPV67DRAFT_309412 [Lyophyllum atratum]|nr:hypothetical protein FPV67DRAFT_309412 [Lyophyllum atratum]